MTQHADANPISYSINNAMGVIFEVWRGPVSADDLKRYWKSYLANPEVMALRRTIVDLREAEILFTGPELRSLIASLVLPALNGKDWTTAIVVAEPVQFGVSRQYSAFAEQYSKDAIFDNIDAALRWLCSRRDRPSPGVTEPSNL